MDRQDAFPERGSYPRELLEVGIREYREVFFKPYRVIYRVMGDGVYVLVIADGRPWRSPPYKEYGAMASEFPRRFGRLCLRALAEGAISESKAAELLDIGIADVDDYMRGVLPSPAAAG